MATKFLNWVDDANVNDNVETYAEFNADTERGTGFQAGTPASAKKVNTALRQANLVASAIMNIVDSNGTLDVQSSASDIQNAIITNLAANINMNDGITFTKGSSSYGAIVQASATNMTTKLVNQVRLISGTVKTDRSVNYKIPNATFGDYLIDVWWTDPFNRQHCRTVPFTINSAGSTGLEADLCANFIGYDENGNGLAIIQFLWLFFTHESGSGPDARYSISTGNAKRITIDKNNAISASFATQTNITFSNLRAVIYND